ncbi:hypothetical protein CYLTODRAFT_459404 [Cylindrobasidium torrendii FP15055 ss-10]|uniref:Uncharacterized protein n=1 Tax=Cylindrobasidium torrendii FP15055 ss-10 TaxID=1314674 RepID=A0A0D7AXG1_9AGAR|nr:hypothetical protein CYLTODRAFT_459404 [Cylindrobasidium torrendii FP15055 ss-10]
MKSLKKYRQRRRERKDKEPGLNVGNVPQHEIGEMGSQTTPTGAGSGGVASIGMVPHSAPSESHARGLHGRRHGEPVIAAGAATAKSSAEINNVDETALKEDASTQDEVGSTLEHIESKVPSPSIGLPGSIGTKGGLVDSVAAVVRG